VNRERRRRRRRRRAETVRLTRAVRATAPAPHRRRGRVGLLVTLLAVGAAVLQFLDLWTADDGARRAVDALRTDTVWVDPASPGVLDGGRARQVIGDRPIVAAVLPPSEESFDRCTDVVAQHPDVFAFVWTGTRGSGICAGDGVREPDLVDDTAVEWLESVILDARYSSRFRVDEDLPDRTPQLEEFVLAFDAAVPAAYSDGMPRRELEVSPRVGLEIAVRLLAAAAAAVVGFLVLRLAALRIAAVRARRRAVRTRRLEQLARTARLADAVLAEHPDDPARARVRADAAGRYVLVLAAVESARDESALDAADAELAALERVVLR